MPRREKPPKYGRHESGQARVVLNGRSIYLGKYGSEESWQEYERVIRRWRAVNGRSAGTLLNRSDLTVAELITLYWPHVNRYYAKNGRPTTEQTNIRQALRPLAELHGRTPVCQFGPLALRAVQQAMIDIEWSRKYINDNVSRIKLMFKWAVANELASASVYHGLASVSGLRRGRSGARETEPVKPARDQQVEAVRPHVSSQVWAMIELQRLTGIRPGEAVIMRACDIDMSSDLWEYRPSSHKGEHHDRERVIPLGPRSQAVIRPFLKSDLQALLFSPADAEAERRALLHANRKTPLSCGNRPGSNRRSHPKRKPKDHYTVDSYRRAIQRACDKAFPPPEGLGEEELRLWRKEHRWHPHQLRHNAGTKIRKELGLEAAQVYLGHSKADVTQIYAERNLELARQIAVKFG